MKGFVGGGGNSSNFARDCLQEVIQIPSKDNRKDLAGVFQYCGKLTKVTFPKNWKHLEGRVSGMFQGDGNLTEIVNFETINFGSSVKNISGMFTGCRSLTSAVMSVVFQSILNIKGITHYDKKSINIRKRVSQVKKNYVSPYSKKNIMNNIQI